MFKLRLKKQDCEEIYRDEDMQDGVDVPALRRCVPDRHTERDLVLSSACVSAIVTQLGTGWHTEHKEKVVHIHRVEREWLFPEISVRTQRRTIGSANREMHSARPWCVAFSGTWA